jgi:hypothetical protein
MRLLISLFLAVLFSTKGEAMEPQFTFNPTIENSATRAHTRVLVADFQKQYIESEVLLPYGLGTAPDERMANLVKREGAKNTYLDQLVYQNDVAVALVNLGQMPVKGYTQAGHPVIAKAWNDLGLTDEAELLKIGLGTGYMTFGFASTVESDTKVSVIKEALALVTKKAQRKEVLPIQSTIPTHFVSLISLADVPLQNALKEAGFSLNNTEDKLGFPGFDSPDEKRNRLIAVYTLKQAE